MLLSNQFARLATKKLDKPSKPQYRHRNDYGSLAVTGEDNRRKPPGVSLWLASPVFPFAFLSLS
jgi:hypothetical protein